MNILNKLQGEYDQLWKYIIRPTRTPYPDSALGPETFTLEGIKIKRNSFQLINQQGHVFYGSHFVPLQATSYPCVLYLHGNSSNQTQGMQYLSLLLSNGISLCTFDFAGCGNSQGDFVTLGYNQYKDVEEVMMFIKGKQKVTKIAVWGRSMGAVTALRFASRHPQISAAVFDSPFKSLKCLINDLCRKNTKVPMFILSGALKIIAGTIKQKAKFDIYNLDPLRDDAPITKTPGFFIVSEQDELIPYEHTKNLYECYKAKKKYLRVVKGEHNGTRPQSCILDVIKFLKKQLLKVDKEQKQKKTQNSNNGEIDFFNDDLLETNFQQKPENAQQSKKQDDIDFFAEYDNQNPQQMQNDIDFASFEQQGSEKSGQSSNLFSLNDIFSGVFTSKKSKPIEVKDGYEELRAKINSIQVLKNQKLNKQISDRIQKQLKNYDSSFETIIKVQGDQYIW